MTSIEVLATVQALLAARMDRPAPMLINELQRQHQAVARQHDAVDRRQRELTDLRAVVEQLCGRTAEQ